MEGVKLTLALFFGRLLRSAIGELQDQYILTILTTLTFTTLHFYTNFFSHHHLFPRGSFNCEHCMTLPGLLCIVLMMK